MLGGRPLYEQEAGRRAAVPETVRRPRGEEEGQNQEGLQGLREAVHALLRAGEGSARVLLPLRQTSLHEEEASEAGVLGVQEEAYSQPSTVRV